MNTIYILLIFQIEHSYGEPCEDYQLTVELAYNDNQPSELYSETVRTLERLSGVEIVVDDMYGTISTSYTRCLAAVTQLY